MPENKLTAAEIEAAKAEREGKCALQLARQKKDEDAAGLRAQAIFEKAAPAEAHGHNYLAQKAVKPHGVRIGDWPYEVTDRNTGEVVTRTAKGVLLIPLMDIKRAIRSLQAIDKYGGKFMLKGGAAAGNFYPIGAEPRLDAKGHRIFLLGEGFATCASAHEATGHFVLTCFNTSGIRSVARSVRSRQPDAVIVLLADNDLGREDGINAGVIAAIAAAKVVGGLVAVPVLAADPTKKCDFNDLHQAEGLEAVARVIEAALAGSPMGLDVPAAIPPVQAPAVLSVPAAGGEATTPLAVAVAVALPPTSAVPVDMEKVPSALQKFWAYLPTHQYLHVPTRELWPAPSVNGHVVDWPVDYEGTMKEMKPADWLDRHRAVQQMTWHPGRAQIIENEVVSSGGWTPVMGSKVFNTYRAPTRQRGDTLQAGPWIDHLKHIYPNDWQHILRWFAHRIQRPGDKINHALVLGGNPGIGKDTILAPVRDGIGAWNWSEVSPQQIAGSQFNPWVQCVVARVSELRDLREDRFAFYETMKIYIAAPPDTLAVNQKHMKEFYVPNVMGVVFTTNNRTDGLYLPANDRRHFVAWSESAKEDFDDGYWVQLWSWLSTGGNWHVVAYLQALDLSMFDAKAPPPLTAAFWTIVHANNAPEDAELSTILREGDSGCGVTLDDLIERARAAKFFDLADDLGNRKTRRSVPHKLSRAGFVPVRNPDAADGLWAVRGRRVAIYASETLQMAEQVKVARTRAARLESAL